MNSQIKPGCIAPLDIHVIYKMRYFKSLIRELQFNKASFKHFFNIPDKDIRQSSVAVIFRVNKPESYFEKYREEIESYYSPDSFSADFSCIPPVELI